MDNHTILRIYEKDIIFILNKLYDENNYSEDNIYLIEDCIDFLNEIIQIRIEGVEELDDDKKIEIDETYKQISKYIKLSL